MPNGPLSGDYGHTCSAKDEATALPVLTLLLHLNICQSLLPVLVMSVNPLQDFHSPTEVDSPLPSHLLH